LVSTASVGLLIPVASLMTGSRIAGRIAGGLAAVYPALIVGAVQVNTVTLEVFWIEVFALAILTWARRPKWTRLAAAGLALGLLSLTRGPALLIWPVVAAWLLVVAPVPGLHRRVVWLAVLSLGLILPQVPWMVRNSSAIGAPVMIATNGGVNFWIGHNPRADGEYAWPIDTDRALAERAAGLSETARDDLYYRIGLEWSRDHPAEEIDLSLRKLWYFLWFRPGLGSSYPNAAQFQQVAQFALMAGYGGVLIAALPGLWLARRFWRQNFVLYGLLPAYAASSVMYFAATRFRAPIEPFLIALAGLGLAWVLSLVGVRFGRAVDEPAHADWVETAPVSKV
jgi:hypothetical protein